MEKIKVIQYKNHTRKAIKTDPIEYIFEADVIERIENKIKIEFKNLFGEYKIVEIENN